MGHVMAALGDFLIKFLPALLGAAVGALVALWGAQRADEKQRFDLSALCAPMLERLVDRFADKPVQVRELEGRLNLLPPECASKRQDVFNLVTLVAQVQENQPEAVRPQALQPNYHSSIISGVGGGGGGGGAGGTGGAGGAGGSADSVDRTPAAAWVAVGFLGPKGSPGDVNFVSAATGATITSPPEAGAVLRAKWQVNVRPGLADWTRVQDVLRIGQCFEVAESRTVQAGGQPQTWARGEAVSCPSGQRG